MTDDAWPVRASAQGRYHSARIDVIDRATHSGEPVFAVRIVSRADGSALGKVLHALDVGFPWGKTSSGEAQWVAFSIVACSINHNDNPAGRPAFRSSQFVVKAVGIQGIDDTGLRDLGDVLRSTLIECFGETGGRDTLNGLHLLSGAELFEEVEYGGSVDSTFMRMRGGFLSVAGFGGSDELELYQASVLREVWFGLLSSAEDDVLGQVGAKFCKTIGALDLPITYVETTTAADTALMADVPPAMLSRSAQWLRIGFAARDLPDAVEADAIAEAIADEFDLLLCILHSSSTKRKLEHSFVRTEFSGNGAAGVERVDEDAFGSCVIEVEGMARPGLIGGLLSAIGARSIFLEDAPRHRFRRLFRSWSFDLTPRPDATLDTNLNVTAIRDTSWNAAVARLRTRVRMWQSLLLLADIGSSNPDLVERADRDLFNARLATLEDADCDFVPVESVSAQVLFGRTFVTVVVPGQYAARAIAGLMRGPEIDTCQWRVLLDEEVTGFDEELPAQDGVEELWIAWRTADTPGVMECLLERAADVLELEDGTYEGLEYAVTRAVTVRTYTGDRTQCAGKVRLRLRKKPGAVKSVQETLDAAAAVIQAALQGFVITRGTLSKEKAEVSRTRVSVSHASPRDEPWASLVAWDFLPSARLLDVTGSANP